MMGLMVWFCVNLFFILLEHKFTLPDLQDSGTRLDWVPPLRSLKVASSLWPVAFLRQVALVWRKLDVTPCVQQ